MDSKFQGTPVITINIIMRTVFTRRFYECQGSKLGNSSTPNYLLYTKYYIIYLYYKENVHRKIGRYALLGLGCSIGRKTGPKLAT